MSKQLIKTMMSELQGVIPQNELDDISKKIAETVDIKAKVGRSNIDAVAKSERIKLAIDKLRNIKEELIEKLYDHGIEDPEKIHRLASKTIMKLNKAMESKYVIIDEVKEEQMQAATGSNDTVETTAALPDEAKVPSDSMAGQIETSGVELLTNTPRISREDIRALVNKRFKIAMGDMGDEIKRIYRIYCDRNGISEEDAEKLGDFVFPFKKSVIKAYKIFKNIDDYLEIPEHVETPRFEELFEAVEKIKDKEHAKKLLRLTKIIEDQRTEKEHVNTPLHSEPPPPRDENVPKLIEPPPTEPRKSRFTKIRVI